MNGLVTRKVNFEGYDQVENVLFIDSATQKEIKKYQTPNY